MIKVYYVSIKDFNGRKEKAARFLKESLYIDTRIPTGYTYRGDDEYIFVKEYSLYPWGENQRAFDNYLSTLDIELIRIYKDPCNIKIGALNG